jgi:hypothetical protein
VAIAKLPDEWFDLLHTLWSKATGCPGYVKADWMKLERIPFQAAEKMAELDESRRSGP